MKMVSKMGRTFVQFFVGIIVAYFSSDAVGQVLAKMGITLDLETLSIFLTGFMMALLEGGRNVLKHHPKLTTEKSS